MVNTATIYDSKAEDAEAKEREAAKDVNSLQMFDSRFPLAFEVDTELMNEAATAYGIAGFMDILGECR